MKRLANFVDGYKTYIAGFGGAGYGLLITLGVAPNRLSVWAILASISVVGIRGVFTKLVNSVGNTTLPVVVKDGDDSMLSDNQPE